MKTQNVFLYFSFILDLSLTNLNVAFETSVKAEATIIISVNYVACNRDPRKSFNFVTATAIESLTSRIEFRRHRTIDVYVLQY